MLPYKWFSGIQGSDDECRLQERKWFHVAGCHLDVPGMIGIK